MPFGYAVLSISAFRRLFIGQAISQMGNAMYYLVFIFMADKITQSTQIVGIVAALQALPFLLLGPVAGVFADRIDRRAIMVASDAATASILFLFAIYVLITGTPSIYVIAIAGFLLSSVSAFFMPARQAAIPALVPENQVLQANALVAATQNLMFAAGVGLSLIVLAPLENVEIRWFFSGAATANGIACTISAIIVAGLPLILPKNRDFKTTFQRDFKDGILTIVRHKVLRILLPISVLIGFSLSGFLVVYVAANRVWFDGAYRTLAGIELSFFVVTVITSYYLGKSLLKKFGVTYGLSVVALGIIIAAMGTTTNFWFFLALNAICGVAFAILSITQATYIAVAVPDGLRGRVNSVYTTLAVGLQPLGIGATGLLLGWFTVYWEGRNPPLIGGSAQVSAESLSLSTWFFTMGMFCAIAAAFALLDRSFRTAVMPTEEPSGVVFPLDDEPSTATPEEA